MFKDMMSSFGTLDVLKTVFGLPKLEFDDYKKLEELVSHKPEIGLRITKALISNRAEYFYKEIISIMKENQIIPDSPIIGDKIAL